MIARSRPLLAWAALALTACGPAGLPPAGTDPPPATAIRGTVRPHSGVGRVTLLTAAGGRLARADLAGDGTFTLALPAASTLSGLTLSATGVISRMGCAGTVTSGDPAARGFGFAALRVEDALGGRTVLAADLNVAYVPPRATLLARAWLYADRPTRLSGTLECGALVGAASAPVAVDLTAGAGWNVVGIVVNVGYGPGGASASGRMSATTDTDTTWQTREELTAGLPGR